MMALVAQHTDEFGGERIVEQLDDVFTPRTVARGDGAVVERALCCVERTFIQHQAIDRQRGHVFGFTNTHGILLRNRVCVQLLTAPMPSNASSTTTTNSTRNTMKR